MNASSDAAWMPRFLFTLTPRDREEFMDMCHYHQTSPDSVFTQQRLVTIGTFEGRVTLTGMRLSITNGAEIHEMVVNSEG
jgi:N-hydroxyarylamine O-acetyltransferase